MRRKQCEITDPAEIGRILDQAWIGRIATTGTDGYPYVTPVNYVHFQENIYFHCSQRGEKLDNIAADPRVCFEVDIPLSYLDRAYDPDRPACHLHQFYHCVIIRGTASVVDDTSLKTDALNALVRKHEPEIDFNPIAADMPLAKACHVIEIRPDSISAKSDLAQKHSQEARDQMARYFHRRNQGRDQDTARAMGFAFEVSPP